MTNPDNWPVTNNYNNVESMPEEKAVKLTMTLMTISSHTPNQLLLSRCSNLE